MAINGGLAVPPDLAVNVERYAVYRCYADDGQLLYVGETGELGTRFASHAQKLWFTQVRGITLEWYADELDALNAERRAIHVEHPKYNVIHRRLRHRARSAGNSRRGLRRAVTARRRWNAHAAC
jgi:excinuclease UvrABC nuclease subunit